MIITGDLHTDHRGIIRFVNNFHFPGIKRFYAITHPDTDIIRAWQGHKLETKYFYVTKGSFLINWIKIDNWEQPSAKLEINNYILTDKESEILIISPGHVNGFKALVPDSTIIIFSNMTLEESKSDDYRFPSDFWRMEH